MEELKKSASKEIIPENNNNPEKKEKPISTIEINGIKIETHKEYFEYPEYIQKETGILGYDRTVISKDSLSNFIEKDCLNRFGINIRDKGFTDLSSLNIVEEYFEKEGKSYEGDEFSKYKRLMNLNSSVCNDIINSLSQGEYPSNCFTHEMGAYASAIDKIKYNENFVDSKFFVQKIYDIDYIKKQKDEKQKADHRIFNDSNWDIKSDISVFNKQTGEKVHERGSMLLADLANPKYFNRIKDGELFACTINSGFNVANKHFFFPYNIKLTNNSPSFGFPMKDDILFTQYLNKSLDIYTKKLKGFDYKDSDGSFNDGVCGVLMGLIITDKVVNEIINSVKSSWELTDNSDLHKLFFEAVNNVVERIEKENKIKIQDYTRASVVDLPEIILRYSNISGNSGHCELNLPVFIGLEEEIPQLRWGHAKYAHFMSSKGFNFIEFKHADHLPQKQLN